MGLPGASTGLPEGAMRATISARSTRRRSAIVSDRGPGREFAATISSELDPRSHCVSTRTLGLGVGPDVALRRPWYAFAMNRRTGLDAYKIVLYRQDDGSWVAEVPAISGCYALMPTREEALAELGHVFDMIAEEFLEKGVPLPEDTTEIVNA